MRPKNSIYKIFSAFLLITSLAACSVFAPTPTAAIPVTGGSPTVEITTAAVPTATLAPTATSTPQPTIDYTPTLNAVRTEAVATAFAGLTQTAQALPTRTLAPLWTLTPTLTMAGCQVLSVSPDVNSPIKPNAPFDGKWEIRNTDSTSWSTSNVSVRFVSGTRFQTRTDATSFSDNLDQGQSSTVIVDMKAPAQVGTYTATWAVYRGGSIVCGLGLTVRVKP
jgi:hypothetical protein